MAEEDYLLSLLDEVRRKSKSPSTLRLLEALTARVVELTKIYNAHEHHGHAHLSDGDEYTSRGDVTVGAPVKCGSYGCHSSLVVDVAAPTDPETPKQPEETASPGLSEDHWSAPPNPVPAEKPKKKKKP